MQVEALGTVVHGGGGRAAVISIHQPPSVLFHQFDRILLLSPMGETVYFGPRIHIIEHFLCLPPAGSQWCPPGVNPAEFLLDAVSHNDAEKVTLFAGAFKLGDVHAREKALMARVRRVKAAAAKGSGGGTTGNAKATTMLHKAEARRASMHGGVSLARSGAGGASQMPSVRAQVSAVAGRCVAALARHPMLIYGQCFVSLVIAVLTAAFFSNLDTKFSQAGVQERAGVVFFVLVYFLLNALVSMGMWQEERLLYLREHQANCYSAGPYLFAKVVFNIIPVQCMSTTTFVAIAYFFVGLNPRVARFVGFLGVLLLSNVVANSLMITIGTLTRKPSVANMLGTFVMLFTLLFGGPLINFVQAGALARGIGYMSFMHYTFEALMENELQGYTFELCAKGTCITEDADFMLGADVLGLELGKQTRDIIVLGVFFVALNVLTFLLLRFWVKEQR